MDGTQQGGPNAGVTVIVVGFNHGKFIRECLDSIRAQTRPAERILVADDASTDNSIDVVRDYLETYRGCAEFFPNDENLGLTRTLNRMLDRVDSEYVTYISADDYMLPDRIERHVELMESTNADIAYSDAIVVGADSSVIHNTSKVEFPWPNEPQRTQDVLALLLQTNWIPAASFFLRTASLTTLGGYNERIFYEDYELLVRMASHACRFAYVDEPLVAVRRLPTSLGAREFGNTNPRFLEALHVALGHFEGSNPTLSRQAASMRWEVAKRSLDTNMPRAKSRDLLRAARRGAGSPFGYLLHYSRTFVPRRSRPVTRPIHPESIQ